MATNVCAVCGNPIRNRQRAVVEGAFGVWCIAVIVICLVIAGA